MNPFRFPTAGLVLALLAASGLIGCKRLAKSDATDSTARGPNENRKNLGSDANTPARLALPTGWREFKHPEGAYSIFVPAMPQRDPKTPTSLRLKQPLGPNESRESNYGVLPTANQPFLCEMRVMLFDPSLQSTFEQSYAMNRPKDDINHQWKEFREVTWGSRRATESVCEKTFYLDPNVPPKRIYQVARYMFTPGCLYTFVIERENQMPTKAEVSTFFDSFVVGG